MDAAHQLILVFGTLGLLSIAAGLLSARLGAPLLIVFLALGMAAGRDGPGGLVFDDYRAVYLIGSVAIAVILFEGGIKTHRATLAVALWPAIALSTLGVAITAGVVAGAFLLFLTPPDWHHPAWLLALLIGATIAPTDAAAVAMLLRRAGVAIPERVAATLEVESGLNDPVSVVLTLLVTQYLLVPDSVSAMQVVLLLAKEIAGGVLFGIGGGWGLLLALRRIRSEAALCPVLALMGAMALFGAAQSLGASGFLAVYLAGAVLGMSRHRSVVTVRHFFSALGWLAQIGLFLMLGLLMTPHEMTLLSILPPALVTVVLIVAARPAACALCLRPFGFTWRETAFASWVGLRGAVPIYLVTIPLLAGVDVGFMFAPTFVIVISSLIVQGWTIAPVARLLGFADGPDAGARSSTR